MVYIFIFSTFFDIIPAFAEEEELERVLICEKREHTHNDDCYLIDAFGHWILWCHKKEHIHTDECYAYIDPSLLPVTPSSAPTVDTNGIVVETVKKEKDKSKKASLSEAIKTDPAHDSKWAREAKAVPLSGNWIEDLIAVAESQIGYQESKIDTDPPNPEYSEEKEISESVTVGIAPAENSEAPSETVSEDGVSEEDESKGFTIYGSWYGIPYGDWCAMYISYCMHTAKINMPVQALCTAWISTLTKVDLYRSTSPYLGNQLDYIPKRGDLVFYDTEADDKVAAFNEGRSKKVSLSSDHVGIVRNVLETEEGLSIETIEGNSGSQVMTHIYPLSAPRILGFGIMPENNDNKTKLRKETEALLLAKEEERKQTIIDEGVAASGSWKSLREKANAEKAQEEKEARKAAVFHMYHMAVDDASFWKETSGKEKKILMDAASGLQRIYVMFGKRQ